MGEDDGEEPYALVLCARARRALTDQLPPAVAAAAWELISGPLAREPPRVGAPLVAPYGGFFRARRGEYRVRYRVDEERRVVEVVDVSHRRDAYRV